MCIYKTSRENKECNQDTESKLNNMLTHQSKLLNTTLLNYTDKIICHCFNESVTISNHDKQTYKKRFIKQDCVLFDIATPIYTRKRQKKIHSTVVSSDVMWGCIVEVGLYKQDHPQHMLISTNCVCLNYSNSTYHSKPKSVSFSKLLSPT